MLSPGQARLRVPGLATDTRRLRSSVWFLAAALACFVGWSYWAEIDQLTRAPGTVIAPVAKMKL